MTTVELTIRDHYTVTVTDEKTIDIVWTASHIDWKTKQRIETVECNQFAIGDTISIGFYNYHFIATLVSVSKTGKTITYERYGKTKKMSMENFVSHNATFDAERAEKQRQDWTD